VTWYRGLLVYRAHGCRQQTTRTIAMHHTHAQLNAANEPPVHAASTGDMLMCGAVGAASENRPKERSSRSGGTGSEGKDRTR